MYYDYDEWQEDPCYDDHDYYYEETQDELEQLYQDAFEGDPDAEWNID